MSEQEEPLATGGVISKPGLIILGGHHEQETAYMPKNASVLSSTGQDASPAKTTITIKPLVIPSVEQMRLIARILDGLCAEFTEPFMTPLGMVAMRCRFCKVPGVPFGIDQMRYEHTDECVLALNDQLQESMKEREK